MKVFVFAFLLANSAFGEDLLLHDGLYDLLNPNICAHRATFDLTNRQIFLQGVHVTGKQCGDLNVYKWTHVKGLYSVTFQQIATKSKITQSAIYRHFADMDDLILEACKHWVDISRHYINEQSSSLEPATPQMQQYLDRHLIYAAKNRAHDGLLFGLYYYAMRSSKMLRVYVEIKDRAVGHLTRILKLGNLDGSWKIGEPEQVAESIHSLVVGEVIKLLIEPKAESHEHRSQRVQKSLTKPDKDSSVTFFGKLYPFPMKFASIAC